uniref:Uncharacterized protein n=1 Tax=Rhodnius prolixus TaxID=13249 RepID=T1HZC0_RHOPR
MPAKRKIPQSRLTLRKVVTDFLIFIMVPVTLLLPGSIFLKTIVQALAAGLTPEATVVSMVLIIFTGSFLSYVLPTYLVWVVDRAEQYEVLNVPSGPLPC